MKEFLSESNIYGQTILQLVSKGNAIISEILRLKDNIPNVFRYERNQSNYCDIIFDFGYFNTSEIQEKKIEENEELRDIDEEFRDNYVKIISRFYLLFESIYIYITELNHSLEDLEEGLFIHQTLETVFGDAEGRQLMCEALYLYGVMLLLLDAYIEGGVREKLLVSYYRYTPQRRDGQYAIDEVCKLLRDTDTVGSKKPLNYPEDFFKRIFMKQTYIDMVISCLRSDDIYNQLSVYQSANHRSTALSSQASMLYVCLYFRPNILHNQASVMREIVDKYFPDNWIISVYMGFTINMVESWENFKAAKMALSNTVTNQNVKFHSNLNGSLVKTLISFTGNYLKEGNVTGENIMKDINKIMNVLKDCNVTVRWLMLHLLKKEKNKKCKQLQDIVIIESKYDPILVFKLLLNTAQLEILVNDHLKNMLKEKENTWESLKKENCSNLKELSNVFGGITPLSRVQKNTNLQNWFDTISTEIQSLNQDQSSSAKKLVKLIQALEEVQEFHQLEKNLHIVQYLSEIRNNLHKMLHTINIKEESLITLHVIADLSYGWFLIDSFTPIMQKGIKKEPTVCIKLRDVFLKLASALETPLLRINQSHSKDLISVSQYYSSELETYVRKVLQIIPETMFEKLLKIIKIQTEVLKELPIRLEKDEMKDYAQLNQRFEFAELTNSISVYSKGIRMMKSTLVGVVCLDPKQLLEDGIRKELVKHVTKSLHSGLIFSSKKDLEQRVENLANIIKGYKKSFEYIQDYININGLKIWQEEITRIMNYYVEKECNTLLRNKVYEWDSKYQSKHVPIPIYESVDNESENFIGRLVREILRLTDPRHTIYIIQNSSWYDVKTCKTIFNKETIKSIESVLEIAGLVGLDKLLCYMITFNLKKVIALWEKKDIKTEVWNVIKPFFNRDNEFNDNSIVFKFIQICSNKLPKYLSNMLDNVLIIGQLQWLRTLINFHLNMSCKFNAKNLESSLKSLNRALIELMKMENSDFLPSEEVLMSLSKYLDFCGMNRPANKIYITTKYNEDNAIFIFALVVSYLQKIAFIKDKGSNLKKLHDKIDGVSFTMGIHTFIKQYPPKLNEQFISNLSALVIESFKHNFRQKISDIPSEVNTAMKFIENYSLHSKLSEQMIREQFPKELNFVLESMI